MKGVTNTLHSEKTVRRRYFWVLKGCRKLEGQRHFSRRIRAAPVRVSTDLSTDRTAKAAIGGHGKPPTEALSHSLMTYMIFFAWNGFCSM
jgi:hypothetical protein